MQGDRRDLPDQLDEFGTIAVFVPSQACFGKSQNGVEHVGGNQLTLVGILRVYFEAEAAPDTLLMTRSPDFRERRRPCCSRTAFLRLPCEISSSFYLSSDVAQGSPESGAETNPSMQTYSPSSSIEMQLQIAIQHFDLRCFDSALLSLGSLPGLFLPLCLLLPSFVLPID